MRITKYAIGVIAVFCTAGLCSPLQALGQSVALGSRGPESWARWNSVGTPTALPTPPQVRPPADDQVLERSILGALVGWSGGIALSLGVCSAVCGDDETDALVVAIGMGMAGGAVGSALLGCTATEERGCTSRVLPRSLLGSVVALAASIGIGVATENGIAAWVTFPAVQGFITSRAIW